MPVGSNALHYISNALIITFGNITKYAIKMGNITQVTLLTNVTRYLSNKVTVTSLILRNTKTHGSESRGQEAQSARPQNNKHATTTVKIRMAKSQPY